MSFIAIAMVHIKRVYSQPDPQDGVRILVDRVWPRGCSKEQVRLDAWRKDLAPSTALRKWFGHDPEKWPEFRTRFRQELRQPEQRAAIQDLARLAQTKTVTLLYGASNREHNQAVVLKELIDGKDRKSFGALNASSRNRSGSGRKVK